MFLVFFFFSISSKTTKQRFGTQVLKPKSCCLKEFERFLPGSPAVLASLWPYGDDADNLIQLFFIDESRSYVAANLSPVSGSAMRVTQKNITFDGKFQVCFILESSTMWCQRKKSYPWLKFCGSLRLWHGRRWENAEGHNFLVVNPNLQILTGEPVVIVAVGSTRL